MKIDRKTFVILFGIMIGTICVAFGTSRLFGPKNNSVEEYVYVSRTTAFPNENGTNEEKTDKEVVEVSSSDDEIVYDGLTLDELASKLDRSLNSVLSGQGYYIASYSLEKGVDPYLAVAIMLHETGCSNQCSSLVTYCNNVGGMKGSPSCGNGGYLKFATIEDGIASFINNLVKNYYNFGLTTPELMGPKYAASTTWATRVTVHMNQIKSK